MTTQYEKVRKEKPQGAKGSSPFSYNQLPVVLPNQNFAHSFIYDE